ncbi:MAG: hypothetical protein PHZ24_06930 [Bacteroidales bacterium]|nr:hypothetical protein [Bacteroidales bacterium]MDY0142673.1 hypothetical protein [Bacteroidales bacterium]
MKNKSLIMVILFIMLSFITINLLGQNEKAKVIDNRLKQGYDLDYLENLETNSPSTLSILTYDLDHSWFIAGEEIQPKAPSMDYLYYKNPNTGEKTDVRVESIDVNNINIAKFYYEREHDSYKFYKIGDSGIIIGFYPALENAKRYNNYKKQ